MRWHSWIFMAVLGSLALGRQAAVAQHGARSRPAPVERVQPASPLTPRERIEQMLDRFTYGPRPGEIDRVLALGADQWFEQQLTPATIPDAVFARRLADLPTVAMSPAQALAVFPDRAQIAAVADGKVPMPDDKLERAVMEVQVARWNAQQDRKDEGKTPPVTEPGDTQTAMQKADQASPARLAGALLALPKEQRMATLIAMPVADRIALTRNGSLPGAQRNLLLTDFTPREREAFLAMGGGMNPAGNLVNELAQARMLRDILSERQLEAVMTDFWFNHFNVFIDKESDRWYTASYERDAIRPHALGKFRDLLLATATSPAMMIYLDNAQSVGPDSLANGANSARPKSKQGTRGLNENYGREVMELHTVGVNGGYSQADVTSLAAILTGWGVDRPRDGGPFAFEPRRHEPGAKAWFGNCISEKGEVSPLPTQTIGVPPGCATGDTPPTPASMQQGIAALKLLAASPQTARFISTLLAQYFVADTPPPALVARLTQTYLASDGDIKAMLRTIVQSPEFNERQYFHNKVKTPVEFLASAYRATATDPQNLGALVNEARTMGMPPYLALPPTGYVLTANEWMNATALVDRLNFAYQLTAGKVPNQSFDAPRLLAMGLLLPGTPIASYTAGGKKIVDGKSTAAAQVRLRSASSATMTGSKAPSLPDTGSQLAAGVLEMTVTGQPVSKKTQALIASQIAGQPASASVTDTLDLITGLLLGSPEFQVR